MRSRTIRKNTKNQGRAPDAPRINRQIRIPQIRVIGPDSDQLGIMSPRDALGIAQSHGLDLVEVAPQAKPPVCRIMDYGKYRYQQSKRKTASKSAQVELKTIRLGTKTDTHDLETKLNKARRFIEKGNKVKFVLQMRGREQAHVPRWIEKLTELIQGIEDIGTITKSPSREGRMITAIVEPNRQGSTPKPASS